MAINSFLPLPLPSFNSFQPQFLPSPSRKEQNQQRLSTNFGEMAVTKTGVPKQEQITEDLDTTIYEIPDLLEIEIYDPLLNILSKNAENLLTDDCVNDKILEDKTLEQIKEEYDSDEIKDVLDDRMAPPPPTHTSPFLSLNKDNNEFVSFLCSDRGQNIMKNNSLSIHVESRDIFYKDFNTGENFCNFLLAKQDK